MDGQVTAGLPLSGVLVLDFSQAEAGPIATQVLADFGARVIKVERYPHGDLMRTGYGHESAGFMLPFSSMNRGKESICLDSRGPQGRAIVDRMLERADVLVHNFRPGVMARLGLAYEEVHTRYPRIVYAEASGFGTTGPWANRGGQDLLAQALGGAMWQNSPDQRRPLPVNYPIADFCAGTGILSGVLMALLQRERTGRGSLVQTSLLEGLMFSMVQEITEARSGHYLTQGGDPLCGVYQATDGYVMAMPIWSPTAASDFLEALGLADLVADPRMATVEARSAHRTWVRETVETRFLLGSVSHWLQRLDEKRILSAPLLEPGELARHEQVAAIDPFVEMHRSDGARIGHAVRPHFTIDGRIAPGSVVPGLGEHTGAILAELGYTAGQTRELAAAEVVFLGPAEQPALQGEA